MRSAPAIRARAAGGWEVEEVSGPAADLHAASADLLEAPGEGSVTRRVRVLHATSPAVVLGSGQSDEVVDRARADRFGIEVARRRSGGGAVLVGPGESVWVDLLVPRSDPLWSDDVRVSMGWVGEVWSEALAGLVPVGLSVWRGAMLRTPWSDLVCFAGVGPGEVLATSPPGGGRLRGERDPPGCGGAVPRRGRPGPKLVGVSQRRSRSGALFQSSALLRWRPLDLLDVLALDPAARREAAVDVGSAACGLGSLRSETVVAAFLAALEAATAR